MPVKMNPVQVRRKLEELEREAAELIERHAPVEEISRNRKKTAICRRWLEEAEKP